jgi:hypothetical protein
LFVLPALAAGSAQSGPQVGQKAPGPFEPLNVTGPDAGKKSCLYCRNSFHPVVMIFARETTPEVIALLKRIDAATSAHGDLSMGSCAIFCNESAALPGELVQVGQQNNLNRLILATSSATGPARYKIAADAEVTVLLYSKYVIKANHAFKKGELNESGIEAIMADLPLILSAD